jgi:aldose sugar dehydrogenase
MKLAKALLLLPLASASAWAQVNAGATKPDATALPFNMTTTDTFELPWRIAFLPDGRMLVTEKIGPVWLVSAQGKKIAPVANTPAVWWSGQSGMHGIYLSPTFATDQNVYITYVEPGENGGSLALGRARLNLGNPNGAPAAPGPGAGPGPRLEQFNVIWRQMPRSRGGQAGGAVAFAPDGKSLFLTVGDRMLMTPAQEPDQPNGKIMHLTLDGKPHPENPNAGKVGARTINLIAQPGDTEAAKTAKVASTYTFPAENLTPSETWASGFRTPYGLAFAPNGELWEVEHAPRSGDELNLIEKGKNYGWPLVAYGPNYSGVPVPHPDTRADLAKAALYWEPNVAPGNMMFYKGKQTFPQWDGNLLVAGLGSQSINRIIMDGKGGAKPAERWAMGKRVRDVAEAADGTLWMIEDANPGALIHLTAK